MGKILCFKIFVTVFNLAYCCHKSHFLAETDCRNPFQDSPPWAKVRNCKNCVMIKLDQNYILISAGDSEKSQKHSDLPLGKREAYVKFTSFPKFPLGAFCCPLGSSPTSNITFFLNLRTKIANSRLWYYQNCKKILNVLLKTGKLGQHAVATNQDMLPFATLQYEKIFWEFWLF